MKVLVTGASGFVGRHLVRELVRRHEVVCLVRPGHGDADFSPATVVKVDLTDPAFVDGLPDGVAVIVHLAQAYLPFPDRALDLFRVNAGSTQQLAEYGRQTGVGRFVLASSGSVYRPAAAPLGEEAATVPHAFHPATKLMGELLLEHYRPFFSIGVLRLFAPYGPGQVDRLLPRLIDSIRSDRPISLSRGGEPHINPIYVADLVRILAQAVDHTAPYTVNVAGHEAASIKELSEIIGRHLGRRPIFEERDLDPAGNFVADTTMMHRVFAVGRLTSLDEGLRLTIDAQVPQPS